MRRLHWWVAPGWALAISLVLLVAPLPGATESASIAADGAVIHHAPRHSWTTMLESDGADAIRAVATPLLLAVLPLLGRTQRARRTLGLLALALLLGFCLLAGSSVGLLFLPSALAIAIAVSREEAIAREAGTSAATG